MYSRHRYYISVHGTWWQNLKFENKMLMRVRGFVYYRIILAEKSIEKKTYNAHIMHCNLHLRSSSCSDKAVQQNQVFDLPGTRWAQWGSRSIGARSCCRRSRLIKVQYPRKAKSRTKARLFVGP